MAGLSRFREEAMISFANMTTYSNGTMVSTTIATSCDILYNENDIFTATLAGCPVSWSVNDDEYRAPSFNGSGINELLRSITRFGKSNDIASAIAGTDDEWQDYRRGLMTVSIFAWTFFLFWFLFLMYCQYTKRLGWLAGGPPPKPVAVYEDTSMYNFELAKYKKHVNILRYVVLFSGMVIIVFSGLLLGYGFHSLFDAIESAQQILPPTVELLSEASNATEKYLSQLNNTMMSDETFINALRANCPWENTSDVHKQNTTMDLILSINKNKTLGTSQFENNTNMNVVLNGSVTSTEDEKISTMLFAAEDSAADDANDATGTNNNSTVNWENTKEGNETEVNAAQSNQTTAHGGPFFQDEMSSIYDFFSNAVEDVMELEESIGVANETWMYIASSCIILINIMTLMFMIGVILAWKQNQPQLFLRTTNRFLLPFFTILVIMTFLMSTICLIWSELLSDLCTGNPDDQVKKMIHSSNPADEFVDWYLGGCLPEAQPDTVLSLVNQLVPVVLDTFLFGIDYLNTSLPIIEQTLTNISHLNLNLTQVEQALPSHRYLQNGLHGLLDAQYCGNNTEDLQSSFDTLVTKLFTLLEVATELIPPLRCEPLNRAYSSFTYHSACNDGITASAWVFLCMFLVSFFGMVIITVRAAWQQMETFASEVDTFPQENNQNMNHEDAFDDFPDHRWSRRRRRRFRDSVESDTRSGTYATKMYQDDNLCC